MKNARIFLAIILAAASVACTGPTKSRFKAVIVNMLVRHPQDTCHDPEKPRFDTLTIDTPTDTCHDPENPRIDTLIIDTLTIDTLLSYPIDTCYNPEKPRFDTLLVDMLVRHPQGTCRLKYRFATIAHADKFPTLQRIEQRNIGHFFGPAYFESTVADAISRELTYAVDLLENPQSPFPRPENRHDNFLISVESDGEIVDTLLCYGIDREEEIGGPRPLYTGESHVYSLRDGHEYTAAEFFGEEKMEALLGLIRTKLYEQCGVTDDRGLEEQGIYPERITAENFWVSRKKVGFSYNKGDIADYAQTFFEVEISRNELEAL